MKATVHMVFVGCLFLTWGCHRSDQSNEPSGGQSIYKVVGERKLALDVHYPPNWKPADKRPAIVFFFGGGWTHGDLGQFKFQAAYLAQRGMVSACADYRIRSKDSVWPDKCVEDAISAVRWIRGHAAQLGIDPDRIVASGGSAGGHLAACTFFADGVSAPEDDPSISPRPNAMVLYNPALNLIALREGAFSYFVSGLDDAMLKRISPFFHVSREAPPTLIIDGTEDHLNREIRQFVEQCKSAGAPVEASYTEGQPHGFFNKSPWLERTTTEVDEFLSRIGYLEKEGKR